MAAAVTLLSVLVTALASCSTVHANIAGTSPPNNACLCVAGTNVIFRSSPCGTRAGSENTGRCFRYTDDKQPCVLSGVTYEVFRVNYNGQNAWAAGLYLDLAADSRCGSSSTSQVVSSSSSSTQQGYTCAISRQGGRVQEGPRPTSHDCKDSQCGDTCRGGQCVAYVKCSCTRNGKYVPATSCWRPGTKVRGSDGKCNRAIARNTAVATFNSSNLYGGHAAVFIACLDDYTIRVYEQWCGRALDYTTYRSTDSNNEYFKKFAVITSPGCADHASASCRVQSSGTTQCLKAVRGC